MCLVSPPGEFCQKFFSQRNLCYMTHFLMLMPNMTCISFENECLMMKLLTVFSFLMNFYAFYMIFSSLLPKLRPDLKLFSQIFYMGFVERKILYKIHGTRFSYSISRVSKSELQSKKTHKKSLSFLENSTFPYEDTSF